jgi:hypothetical protein
MAGFGEALDGMRADVTSAACDEDVHGERDTANVSGGIGGM